MCRGYITVYVWMRHHHEHDYSRRHDVGRQTDVTQKSVVMEALDDDTDFHPIISGDMTDSLSAAEVNFMSLAAIFS